MWFDIFLPKPRSEHLDFLLTFDNELEFGRFCHDFYGKERWHQYLLSSKKLDINIICDELIREFTVQEMPT